MALHRSLPYVQLRRLRYIYKTQRQEELHQTFHLWNKFTRSYNDSIQHNDDSVHVAVPLGSVNLICAKKHESGKRNFVDTLTNKHKGIVI